MSTDLTLEEIAPFFIVKNLATSIDFYNQKLGFETDLLIPEEDPFFGIVSVITSGFFSNISLNHPVPNHTRHRGQTLSWDDAFLLSINPMD